MTDISARTPSFAGYARRAVEFTARVDEHAESERSPILADTLNTVTPDGTLTWMDCYAWAAPAPLADGSLRMSLSTDWDSIVGFYADGKKVFNLKRNGDPLARLTTDWYGMLEATGYLDIFSSGPLAQDWVLLAPLDGPGGISGEIAWGRFDHRVPGPELTDNDRARNHLAYVQALREENVEGVLATLSDDVVGAARDHTDASPSFIPVNGRDAVREYYTRFFAAYRVEQVTPVTILSRGWYVFSELAWTLVRRDDPTSRRLSLLTADILVLDVDGRVWAKAGYGTPVEPLD